MLMPIAMMANYNPGYIPMMLSDDDPRPAKEQLDEAYKHGGGWRPMEGWTLNEDTTIQYPGDPALEPRCIFMLRDETIIMYDHAWVVIIQPDRSFEISRMD